MSKMFSPNGFQSLLVALALVTTLSNAKAQDHFALALGTHDDLVIFGPKGERLPELAIPTIDRSVTVGSTSFQVSYGRDANDLLTAVLTPNAATPQDLHFTVCGRTVDAGKDAVVTLTFRDERHVTIDPGYVGTVTVDSHSLRQHELAGGTTYTPAPPMHRRVVSPSASSPPPVPRLTPNVAPRDMPAASAPSSSPGQSTAWVGAPPLASLPASTTPAGPTPTPMKSAAIRKLYWSEPVTPVHGPALSVRSDEMKLIDVHGNVTVKSANGDTMPGKNGMIVPSGSTVSTAANSSAAVFMGGVNSARFLPGSKATVAQGLSGSVRKTNIDLHSGFVFCRVGRHPGETQDYKVHTSQGVAAARGTELLVGITDVDSTTYTLCITKTGDVLMTDSAGNGFDISPKTDTQVAVGSVPGLPLAVEKTLLINALLILAPFNAKLDAIGAAIASGSPVSAADRAFYNGYSDTITSGSELVDALTGTLLNIFGSTPVGSSINNGNGTTTTNSTSTSGTTTTSISTTIDNATGAIVGVTTTITTINADGTTTVTTTTTDAGGNTTTTTGPGGSGTSTSTGTGTPLDYLPATGTLNSNLNNNDNTGTTNLNATINQSNTTPPLTPR